MKKYETAHLQHVGEMERFIALLKREGVRSFLEVGSKFGGNLWRIANSLPNGSRIASVDLPWGDTSFKESQPHLEECIRDLRALGYDSHLHLGDSTTPDAIAFAQGLAPFDCVLIDANHTEPYVRKDWAAYGPMGRMVAFHDIGWIPRDAPSKKMPIDVPKVWAEIKQDFRHCEIRECSRDNGIGVLWR